MKCLFVIYSFFLSAVYCYSQKIQGIVLDASSNLALEGASIKTSESGTVTNKNGEFEIDFKDYIIISSLGFQTIKISASDIKDKLSVYMKHATFSLDEVIITNSEKKILSKSINNLKTNTYYSNTFYREHVTLSGKNTVAFKELFIEKELNNQEINNIAIKNARFFEKEGQYIRFDNAININSLPIIQAESKKSGLIISPIRINFNDFFDISKDAILEDSILVIKFEPILEYKKNGLTGKIFIDLKNESILKVIVNNFKLDMPSFKETFDGNEYKADNIVFDITWNYENNHVKSIYLKNSSSFTFNNNQPVPLVSDCILYFLGDYAQKKRTKYKPINKFNDDVKAILNVKYNPKFWLENPIIKRNSSELAIIKEFENSNSFSNVK